MRLSPLCIELLQYFEKHPQACDTLSGLTEWRILQERIDLMLADMKSAIDQLVRLDLVTQTSLTGCQPLYSLNREKLNEVRSLLKVHTKPKDPRASSTETQT